MKLESRFNIGDKVIYIVDHVKRVRDEGRIVSIHLIVGPSSFVDVYYSIRSGWLKKPVTVHENFIDEKS